MYMERAENFKMYREDVLLSFSFPRKYDLEQLGMKGEVLFFAYVLRTCTYSIACKDMFMCCSTYLTSLSAIVQLIERWFIPVYISLHLHVQGHR